MWSYLTDKVNTKTNLHKQIEETNEGATSFSPKFSKLVQLYCNRSRASHETERNSLSIKSYQSIYYRYKNIPTAPWLLVAGAQRTAKYEKKVIKDFVYKVNMTYFHGKR